MGGGQTRAITIARPGKFACIGLLSGVSIALFANRRSADLQEASELKKAGINAVFCKFPRDCSRVSDLQIYLGGQHLFACGLPFGGGQCEAESGRELQQQRPSRLTVIKQVAPGGPVVATVSAHLVFVSDLMIEQALCSATTRSPMRPEASSAPCPTKR